MDATNVQRRHRPGDGRDVLSVPAGVYKQPELHTVTVSGTDRNGRPSGGAVETMPWAELVNLDTGEPARTYISNGRIAARVPSGRYGLTAVVDTLGPDGAYSDSTLFSRPMLTVDRDVEIVADARRGTRISARLDSTTATPTGGDEAGVTQTIAGQTFSVGLYAADPATGLYAVPSEQVTERPFFFYFAAVRAEPPKAGTVPRAYHLGLRTQQRIPEQTAFRVRDDELAVVDSRYHGDKPLTGMRQTVVRFPGQFYGAGGGAYPVSLPGRRIELYTPSSDLSWGRWLDVGPDWISGFSESALRPPALKAGQRTVHDWNGAAFGTVASGIRKCPSCPMAFTADAFDPVDSLSQRDGATRTRITVSRDGQVIASGEGHNVVAVTPPGEASYTLQATAERQADWTSLGVRSESRWTFPYTPPTGKRIEQLPVHTVRVRGAFDEGNRAPSGAPFRLYVTAEDLRDLDPSPALPRLRTVTVEVSYDEGGTWRPLKVEADGENRWKAEVTHPKRHQGHVSLRLHAADGAGTSIDQTVIRAYGLR